MDGRFGLHITEAYGYGMDIFCDEIGHVFGEFLGNWAQGVQGHGF